MYTTVSSAPRTSIATLPVGPGPLLPGYAAIDVFSVGTSPFRANDTAMSDSPELRTATVPLGGTLLLPGYTPTLAESGVPAGYSTPHPMRAPFDAACKTTVWPRLPSTPYPLDIVKLPLELSLPDPYVVVHGSVALDGVQ